MTQAIVNNLDMLNNAVLTETAADFDAEQSVSGIFDSILGKIIENDENCTLGDMKNSDSDGDMSEQLESFKEFLLQTTREVNMEKSLDLTLARDITDIIKQLQSAIRIEYPIDTEINEDTSDDVAYGYVLKEQGGEDSNNTDETSEDALPMFEQLLGSINISTNISINNNENINPVNQCSTESKEPEYNLTIKPKETIELETDKSDSDTSLNLDNDMLSELNIESFGSDTNTSNDNFMTNQQSPEELGLKVMLNREAEKFEINFEKNIGNGQPKPVEVSPEKIIEQITKHFDSLKSTSKLNIVLNPESLGKVNLQILNTKDGLSAQFTVTTNDARELLMKGLDGLKETLLAQGVAVDNISVKVTEAEDTYNPDWTEQESEGGNKEQGKQKQEEKEKGLFEKTIAQSLKENNGNV